MISLIIFMTLAAPNSTKILEMRNADPLCLLSMDEWNKSDYPANYRIIEFTGKIMEVEFGGPKNEIKEIILAYVLAESSSMSGKNGLCNVSMGVFMDYDDFKGIDVGSRIKIRAYLIDIVMFSWPKTNYAYRYNIVASTNQSIVGAWKASKK